MKRLISILSDIPFGIPGYQGKPSRVCENVHLYEVLVLHITMWV